MNENIQSAERDNLMSRLWRTLIMWDEAVGSSPIELLEKRVAALEHEVRQFKNSGANPEHRCDSQLRRRAAFAADHSESANY